MSGVTPNRWCRPDDRSAFHDLELRKTSAHRSNDAVQIGCNRHQYKPSKQHAYNICLFLDPVLYEHFHFIFSFCCWFIHAVRRSPVQMAQNENDQAHDGRKRVLIVGAGAAGYSRQYPP